MCPLRAIQLNTSLVFNLCLELTLKMVATTTTHQMPNVLFQLLPQCLVLIDNFRRYWNILHCVLPIPAHAVGGRDGQGHQPTAVVSKYLSYYDFVIWERIQLLIPAWQQQGHPHQRACGQATAEGTQRGQVRLQRYAHWQPARGRHTIHTHSYNCGILLHNFLLKPFLFR